MTYCYCIGGRKKITFWMGTVSLLYVLPHFLQVLYYNGKLYWVNSWENRMALVQNPPVSGDASVMIHNVQPSDSGLYICDVTNPNDWSGSGQGLINLTVLGKRTSKTMNQTCSWCHWGALLRRSHWIPLPMLTFLFPYIYYSVPPSVPVCELSGHTYVGDDATLTCHSSQGVPTPIYSWARAPDTSPLPPNSIVAGTACTITHRDLSKASSECQSLTLHHSAPEPNPQSEIRFCNWSTAVCSPNIKTTFQVTLYIFWVIKLYMTTIKTLLVVQYNLLLLV